MALDHSVRTVGEAVDVAEGDLKAALGLLDARHVAGDSGLTRELVERSRERWRQRAAVRLPQLAEAVAERAAGFGEVAFLLEPDLKEARGGLRDVHALRALAAAQLLDVPGEALRAANELLLDVRGALPVRGRRRDDRLLLQEQDAVADRLGFRAPDGQDADDGRSDADVLAHAVAAAGRRVAFGWDTGWYQVQRALAGRTRRWRPSRRPVRRPLDEGVVEQDGEVVLALGATPAADPVLVLRAAGAAARAGLALAPYTLERLATESALLETPWPAAARDALVGLLAAGRPAVAVLEALDQAGVLVGLLPVWAHVRSLPQRNAYHRFTVDRHLVEAAVNAAALTRRVARPDLLLLGALFHDIGKGRPGDHSATGAVEVARIGPGLGLEPPDADVLTTLVREHLLLPDVATRRDLSDPATAERVAAAVGSREVLDLLHALTEADSLATGPAAWGSWKASLVAELVERTAEVLGGTPRPRPPRLDDWQRSLLAGLAPGEVRVVADAPPASPVPHDTVPVTVVAADRPGLLAAVAGVLALARLDVRRAVARTEGARDVARTEGALGLVDLAVTPRHGDRPDPVRLRADLLLALDGRLDLSARLAERERSYPRRPGAPPALRFEPAEQATVLEVRAPDGAGVLHRVVTVLTDLGLDVRLALVSTLGLDVVDTFYLAEPAGGPLAAARQAEVRDAVLGALAPPGLL